MCRHLYNWSLAERIDAYKKGEKINYYDQQNALPEMKKERTWFKSVNSMVLQNVLRRLDFAYKSFFRRVKEDNGTGFPKFKKRGQWRSITYTQHVKQPIGDKIKVDKIGLIKIVKHRSIPENAKVKTLTISKEAGKWFACFSFEFESQIEPKQDLTNAVGIDLGLIDFFYPSEGDPISAPKYLRKSEERLKKLQSKLSKTKKRTHEYSKTLKALQKVHYKIKCQRNDFLHKTVNDLLNSHDFIIHEKLNIKNMIKESKYKLNKSISDAGWGNFLNILNYKANEQGKGVHAVNPYMTSQMCSQCGEIVKKSLSTRTHRCQSCGFTANRDLNAAQNILRLVGLESMGISQEALALTR